MATQTPTPVSLSAALGGKAAALVELRDAGFNVPPFEVSPQDLAAACERLGFPLAVRSSATVEDGARSSFAGQFRSFLNLRSIDEVADAVQRVRDSAHEPGVIQYCRHHGIDPALVRMQVIVQRMVQPQLAGMAFTVNPATGAEEVVIEACEGLADELLLGQREPLPADHPLLRLYRPKIEETARAIQRHFGCPQDIEFAIEGGKLHVLQARPVTRIAFSPDIGEWTNADFRDGGVSSAVCSPLMWSLYDLIWESQLKGFLREIKLLDGDFAAGRMFFGRPYWNVGAVKRCLAKLPGFVEREFDTDLQIEVNYEGDGIRTPMTLRGIIKALPTVFALKRFFKAQDAAATACLHRGSAPIESRYLPMPADIDASFRRLIEVGFFAVESAYFRTIYAASMAKLDLKEAFPDADYAALAAGLPEIEHMAPLRAMRQMKARGERDIGPIITQFAHHGSRGLDIIQPRWDEDRAFVEEVFERMTAVNVAGTSDDPHRIYERARAETIAKLPWWKRGRFERKLARLRRFVWLREEMRDLSSRMYHLIRRYALEIARRRGLGDDVFFMTFAEVVADDRSHVGRRRDVYEGYRRFAAPNEIGGRFRFDSAVRRGDGALCGIGVSRGVATGTARIARTAEEAMRIEPGAILVCPFTDPGWTVVLDRVGGVVTEVGGMLSHAAVICREYGIPAVLGVRDATRLLRDGQKVTVDGDGGCVKVEE